MAESHVMGTVSVALPRAGPPGAGSGVAVGGVDHREAGVGAREHDLVAGCELAAQHRERDRRSINAA